MDSRCNDVLIRIPCPSAPSPPAQQRAEEQSGDARDEQRTARILPNRILDASLDLLGVGVANVGGHAIEAVGADGVTGAPPPYDGFSEQWYPDEDTFLRTIESPEWQELVEDGYNVFDMDGMWGAVLDERVVKGERELAAAQASA